jgi:TolB-like protein
MPSWEELRRRKIVQWALAYLAGAWVALQLLDVVAEPWGIGSGLLLAAQILLAFGFCATLVLAWYHGEQGRQRVSGAELLMLAALLVIAGAAVAFVRGDGESAAAGAGEADTPLAADSIPERSIAVLPLDNLSPADEHAYFAGAMTEAITNALEEVPTFRVISRNSAARFAESDRTVGDFAREELGVAHVIEGSVQREGDRALITVQLIDASTEEHVWSRTYDERVVDVIDVQADVAEQVADQLAATFTERDRRRIVAGATDDPVAYDLYLEAMEQPSRTRDEFERRMELYRQAVRADSTFARAWYELGLGYWYGQGRYGFEAWSDSSRAALDRASKFAADSALIASLERIRALLSGDRRRYFSRLRRFARANPSDVEAAATLANTYWALGDLTEAVGWRRHAIELDPLNAGHWQGLGFTYTILSLDSLAETAWRRAVELGDEFAWRGRVDLHLLRGDHDAALEAVDSLRVHDDPWADLYEGRVRLWSGESRRPYELLTGVSAEVLTDAYTWAGPSVAHAHLADGDTARAREVLRGAEGRIAATPDSASSYLRLSTAAVRAGADRATEVLRDYAEAGGREARWIRVDPVFARVRQDSAFEAELAELEEIVERQRRRVERDLADGGR